VSQVLSQNKSTNAPLNLKTLLYPHSEDSFLCETLGRSPLHIAGTPEKFTDLLSWDIVNRLITYGGLTFPRLRLVSGDEDIPGERYYRASACGFQRPLPSEVHSLLGEGATLVIEAIEELHEPIAMLCQALEDTLQLPVQSDLLGSVAAPPSGTMRWNDHEKLVLQIAGATFWQVHAPTFQFPTAQSEPSEPGEGRQETVLTAGDVFYLPRGWWHSAKARNQAELRLTVMFRNPTGLDICGRMVDLLYFRDAMRMDYPRFGSCEVQSQYLTNLRAEIIKACSDAGLTLCFFKEMRAMAEPRIAFNLPRIDLPAGLSVSDAYEVVPLVRFPSKDTILHIENDDAVSVSHMGRVFWLGKQVGRVFEHIVLNRVQSVAALYERCGEDLSWDMFVECLTDLTKLGLIALRDCADSPPAHDCDPR
jgi:ribosomal protein L16 Arg81 hydroxylase